MDDFIETLHFVTVTLVMRGYNGKTNRVLTHMVLGCDPWYCMKTGCKFDLHLVPLRLGTHPTKFTRGGALYQAKPGPNPFVGIPT